MFYQYPRRSVAGKKVGAYFTSAPRSGFLLAENYRRMSAEGGGRKPPKKRGRPNGWLQLLPA